MNVRFEMYPSHANTHLRFNNLIGIRVRNGHLGSWSQQQGLHDTLQSFQLLDSQGVTSTHIPHNQLVGH